jgi:hypothetical protein
VPLLQRLPLFSSAKKPKAISTQPHREQICHCVAASLCITDVKITLIHHRCHGLCGSLIVLGNNEHTPTLAISLRDRVPPSSPHRANPSAFADSSHSVIPTHLTHSWPKSPLASGLFPGCRQQMSLTNPPSTATGPGSVSAVRTQTLKRSVQAAFEGMDGFPDLRFHVSCSRLVRFINPVRPRFVTGLWLPEAPELCQDPTRSSRLLSGPSRKSS